MRKLKQHQNNELHPNTICLEMRHPHPKWKHIQTIQLEHQCKRTLEHCLAVMTVNHWDKMRELLLECALELQLGWQLGKQSGLLLGWQLGMQSGLRWGKQSGWQLGMQLGLLLGWQL